MEAWAVALSQKMQLLLGSSCVACQPDVTAVSMQATTFLSPALTIDLYCWVDVGLAGTASPDRCTVVHCTFKVGAGTTLAAEHGALTDTSSMSHMHAN